MWTLDVRPKVPFTAYVSALLPLFRPYSSPAWMRHLVNPWRRGICRTGPPYYVIAFNLSVTHHMSVCVYLPLVPARL